MASFSHFCQLYISNIIKCAIVGYSGFIVVIIVVQWLMKEPNNTFAADIGGIFHSAAETASDCVNMKRPRF